jgi:hypothetical protein
MRRHRFNQHQPLLGCVVDNHIGHLPMRIDFDAQRSQAIFGKESKFLVGITDVQYLTTRCKALRELVNYLLDKNILPTRRELERYS